MQRKNNEGRMMVKKKKKKLFKYIFKNLFFFYQFFSVPISFHPPFLHCPPSPTLLSSCHASPHPFSIFLHHFLGSTQKSHIEPFHRLPFLFPFFFFVWSQFKSFTGNIQTSFFWTKEIKKKLWKRAKKVTTTKF